MSDVVDTQNHWVSTSMQIFLQSTLLVVFGYRIANSPVFSGKYASLSLLQRVKRHSSRTLHLLAIFVTTWVFLACVALLQNGYNLSVRSNCSRALTVCLWGYGVNKFALYSFLIERAHVVRDLKRREDYLYWFNLLLLAGGVVLVCLAQVYRWVSTQSSRCYIGPNQIIISLLGSYDVFLVLFWTAQFIYPILRSSWRRRVSQSGSLLSGRVPSGVSSLVIRTAVGSLLISFFTCINMMEALIWRKHMDAWIRLILWSVQMTMNCVVIHFITNDCHNQAKAKVVTDNEVLSKEIQATTTTTMQFETINLDSEGSQYGKSIEKMALSPQV